MKKTIRQRVLLRSQNPLQGILRKIHLCLMAYIKKERSWWVYQNCSLNTGVTFAIATLQTYDFLFNYNVILSLFCKFKEFNYSYHFVIIAFAFIHIINYLF